MHENEIRHHGILGQHWGIRRFQNKDGSLTPAGKKRYNVDIETAKKHVKSAKKQAKEAYKDYNKAALRLTTSRKELASKAEAYKNECSNLEWQKSKLTDEKAKAALNKETGKKSKHRLKLEQMYRDRGMSAEEAEVAAYKRTRTEKILATVGGTAIAGTAAYVAYKHWDKTVDKMIKPGTMLQNVSNNSNKGVEDAFYFSSGKLDNTKYKGLYGHALLKNGPVYETKIRAKTGLKVASEKHAQQALAEMVNQGKLNPGDLSERLKSWGHVGLVPSQQKVFDKALQSLGKGQIDKNVYDAFNITLPYQEGDSSYNAITKSFYNHLKSKGYDAIMDVNDKKYSGFLSSKPMIAFNASGKAVVDGVRELGINEISKDNAIGTGAAVAQTVLKQWGPMGVGTVAVGRAVSAAKKHKTGKMHDDVVKEYREKHPESKLSYNEIIDAYYKK